MVTKDRERDGNERERERTERDGEGMTSRQTEMRQSI
jgi:hypothetical protein